MENLKERGRRKKKNKCDPRFIAGAHLSVRLIEESAQRCPRRPGERHDERAVKGMKQERPHKAQHYFSRLSSAASSSSPGGLAQRVCPGTQLRSAARWRIFKSYFFYFQI